MGVDKYNMTSSPRCNIQRCIHSPFQLPRRARVTVVPLSVSLPMPAVIPSPKKAELPLAATAVLNIAF